MPTTKRPATGRSDQRPSGDDAYLQALSTAQPPPPPELTVPDDPRARPRIVIADDDAQVVQALQNSARACAPALDIRFWQAGEGNQDDTLIDYLQRQIGDGWQPDVLVLDINLAHGGTSSIDYLGALRQTSGLAALAVVLATVQRRADLDAGRLPGGVENVTQMNPRDWLEKVKPYEPEAILYGKAGSIDFLIRVGESASTWRQMARRRAWQGLLDRIAEQLDGQPELKSVGQTIVDYARNELAIDYAFVYWRTYNAYLEPIACAPLGQISPDDKVRVAEVPLLEKLLDRQPVVLPAAQVDKQLLGPRYAARAGHHCLGVGAKLEERMVGFITLFRRAERPVFDQEVDGKPLAILARLLAAALGRVGAIDRLRDRQQELLDFAHQVAKAKNQQEICQQLAEFLHKDVHGADNNNSKVTVRLIDFGSGLLKRQVCVGLCSQDPEISIFSERSIYAWTVRHNQSRLLDDIAQCKEFLCTHSAMKTELCVPLAIGKHAIGAVNLEHSRSGKYKDHDQPFVESAAALAAQALANFKNGEFTEALLAYVEQYAQMPAAKAEETLRDRLHQFCGYSVLITMRPTQPADPTQPWRQEGALDLRLQDGDKTAIETDIAASAAGPAQWKTTWLGRLVAKQDWQNNSANFTDDKNNFRAIKIHRQFQQQAEAVLWIRRRNKPSHRALLLFWGLPPPLGAQDLQALEHFARLFSALEEREDRLRSLVEQNLIGEQAGAIGHVMQHFRHRLTNQTGDINGTVDNLQAALARGETETAQQLVTHLQQATQKLATSFSKAQGYVKKVDAVACAIDELIDGACTDLSARLQGITVERALPAALSAWTDPAIAQMIVYSLLENAADALEGRAEPRIIFSAAARDEQTVRLRIEDNGHGVAAENVAQLFQFGFTTKSGGLGSALAFARVRARLLGGDLRYADRQPAAGATFELSLPCSETAFQAAQTAAVTAGER
ncbi:MAG TPA: GAF domain-containing protein [Accumulibacter sp.]|nr:GAF domain-containing protein [Accumulibacter sp.]